MGAQSEVHWRNLFSFFAHLYKSLEDGNLIFDRYIDHQSDKAS